jgi:5-methylcytosine-specific restriction protein B
MKNSELKSYLERITPSSVKTAMELIDLNGVSNGSKPRYYEACFKETNISYPPVLLIRYAYKDSVELELPDNFFDNIGKKSLHFKFLKENGFDLVPLKDQNEIKMDITKIIFKKVPLNEVGNGTEISLLKHYLNFGLIDDPKDANDVLETNGSKSYGINVFFKNFKYNYCIKAYKTKNYEKDRRLIITSKDPLGSARKEDDYVCLAFSNDKISKDSDVFVFIVSKDDDLYETINTKYIDNGDNGLVVTKSDDLFETLLLKKGIQSTKGIMKHPLNQILYGPPGTGKTYSTITKALDIIGVDYEDYDEAQELFQAELDNRIAFVTMHQSFSYEDFVQGLKPEKGKNGVEFNYKNGAFKEICKRAEDTRSGDSPIQQVSLTNGELLMISFYLSKFNGKKKGEKKANEFLGYESDNYAFIGISVKTGHKPNSIKNHRDKFDFMFNDKLGYTARNGWTPRNKNGVLDNTAKWPYQDVYTQLDSLSFDVLSKEVKYLFEKSSIVENEITTNQNFVIILDEINRANISRVFGELIALIEEDKRDGKLTATLPSGDSFTVPSNLYIIGTMNTADKSIALVDIALRRRFKFEAMYPNTEVLRGVLESKGMSQSEIDRRVKVLTILNQIIRAKKTVDYEIGHSYFMSDDKLEDIMNEQVLPLLNEYFMYDLRAVKALLEKKQTDRDKKDIPMLGVVFDSNEYKNRGLLKIEKIDPSNVVVPKNDNTESEKGEEE